MRRVSTLLAVVGAMLLLYVGGALAQPPTPTQNIADRYIVVLKDSVAHPAAVANEHARAYGLQLRFVYSSALEGYAAVFPNDRALQRVRNDARVDYVEPDGVVSATQEKAAKPSRKPGSGGTTTTPSQVLPWGIDKIDADASSTLAGNGLDAVSGVNAYIIDSGIDPTHTDLNVVGNVNPSGAAGGDTDCNGHGTHVAGTVAAKDNTQDVVGVAPGTPLTGVKVLGCSGSGSWSGVIAGIDWVTQNAAKPAVANMSLGGGANSAVDDAVRNSADSGVFYSIAAGNDGANACNYSPARAGRTANGDGTYNKNNGVTTVAATNSTDGETSWSNYGACVDIWAPGASILSTKMGGGTTTMSGTSMAAPHVGGGGALYLSNPNNTAASSSGVEAALKAAATSTGTTSKNGAAIKRENVSTF